MPTMRNPALVGVQSAGPSDDVILDVSYLVICSPLQRHLAAHGLVFEEQITIIGEDAAAAAADLVLATVPPERIEVSAGTDPLEIPRQRTLTVPRSSLREDRGVGRDDIDARIDVVAIGPPIGDLSTITPEISLSPATPWIMRPQNEGEATGQ